MEDLIELATFLDRIGMVKEADLLDEYMRKNSQLEPGQTPETPVLKEEMVKLVKAIHDAETALTAAIHHSTYAMGGASSGQITKIKLEEARKIVSSVGDYVTKYPGL